MSYAGLFGGAQALAQALPERASEAEVMPAAAPGAQPEAIRFEFRAPEGCSSAEDFSARVRRRSVRILLVADATAPRSLRVEIQQPTPGGALRGTVTVVEPGGTTRTRKLKAASCDEAVDALSLIATVTLDPDAMLGEPPPDTKPPPAPAPAPKRPLPRHPRPTPSAQRARALEPYRYGFGLEATLLLRVAPEASLGGSAFVALEAHPGRVFSPLGRLSITHAQSRAVAAPGGQANFAFTLPTLDLCPLRLGPEALAVRPCASASAGLLEVWGSQTPHNEAHARFFGAVGGSLLLGLKLSKALEIIADGRAGVPLRRDDFGFDGVPFFTTPTPGFSTGVGVAGGFP